MQAVEFQASVVEGKIEIPDSYRDQFNGKVNVILYATGADRNAPSWPKQNRRRWELIAKTVRNDLTSAESKELMALQQLADQQLAHVGPRRDEELERLHEQLAQKE